MEIEYPKKLPPPSWDTLNVEYPVRKFPDTGISSTTKGHDWRGLPEIMMGPKIPLEEIKAYHRDYNLTKEKMQSEYTVDFKHKHFDTKRHNKHTACTENQYINNYSRRLADQPPLYNSHGTSETKSAFTSPTTPARLVTDKDQHKHPFCLAMDPPPVEPSFYKEIEPLDTTYEGFEKYLDPYLTTSRLHHRPYTSEQLKKQSNSKDIVTYYTFSDVPMTRTPKSTSVDWRLPHSRPKSMYDREKFKEGCREIRTHKTAKWVPGAFRTEVRDNFTAAASKPEAKIHNYEKDVRSECHRALANLTTNAHYEHTALLLGYTTENSTIGSRKPISSVFDQYPEKNKRLEMRELGYKIRKQNAKLVR